jgi:CBS domain-containing protein
MLAGSDRVAALDHPVTTAMTHYAPQVGPDVDIQRVAHLLRASRCDALVVIDADEALLGIITMVDVVAAVARDRASPS